MEETKRKSGFATAGLVLGIIGICTSFIPIINNLSFILAIIGLIFGIVSLLKRASKGQAIAAVILCVLTMTITINTQKAMSEALDTVSDDLNKATGSSTEEILKNDADVVLGEFTVKKGSYGINETKLPVTVKNKTQENKTFTIQIEAVNPDGSRITTDYINANNLTAGQSQSFEAFTYVSDENLEVMKNATFNIVEVSMY